MVGDTNEERVLANILCSLGWSLNAAGCFLAL